MGDRINDRIQVHTCPDCDGVCEIFSLIIISQKNERIEIYCPRCNKIFRQSKKSPIDYMNLVS